VSPSGPHSCTRRRVAAALVLPTLIVVGVVPAQARSARHCSAVTTDGAWTRLGSPQFSAGPAAVSGYTVSSDGATVYVTNGSMVVRSTDLGCSWRPVFTATTTTTGQSRIARLATPSAGATGTLYVGLVENVDAAGTEPTSVIAASTDAGGRWTTGAAIPGEVIDVEAAGSEPSVVYAVTRQPAATDPTTQTTATGGGVVARSTDGGGNWTVEQVAAPSARNTLVVGVGVNPANTPRFSGVTIDPANAQHLWLYGPDGLYESSDGGANTSSVVTFGSISGNGVSMATAGRTLANRTQLALVPGTNLVQYTRVGAKNPDQLAVIPAGTAAAPVTSVVTGPRPGEFAAATAQQVLLHLTPATSAVFAPDRLLDVSPAHTHVTDLTSVRSGARFTVYGRAGNTIEYRVMPTHPPALPTYSASKRLGPNQNATLSLDASGLRHAGQSNISPDHVRITMKVGQHRTIPYALGLPGSRKVDVFFLVDISATMADKIHALKLALGKIVNDLHAAKVDAWFGVGEFRSYVQGPAYQRVRDVAPPSQGLSDAISGLYAAGGNHTTVALAALKQIATGTGQSDPNAFIASGQQAHFRADALPLVLTFSDESFATGAPNPSYAEVGAALRGVRARQIGVAFQAPCGTNVQCLLQYPTGAPDPAAGESTVARLTGAVAPPEGADCNGDGQPDLAPGQPLVCIVDPAQAANASAIAPAIVNTVLAAPDKADVRMTWRADRRVISGVSPVVVRGVDLRYPTRLIFAVTYSCPASLPAGVYPATLTAWAQHHQVAQARALIDCSAPALAPLAAAPPAAGLALAPAPAPPAEPVTNVQPQGQPQPNPQSQPQAQAQAGAAHQEQEEAQFAFAYTNPAGEGERELAFSRYHSSPTDGSGEDPAGWLLAAAATGMTAAAAVGLARPRRRTVLATAHSNRRRDHR
jgi:hypothetical protein